METWRVTDNDRELVLLGFFRNRRRRVLGVDITATSVSFAGLVQSSSGYRLDTWGHERLSRQGVNGATISRSQEVKDTLSRLLAPERFSPSDVVVAVADTQLLRKVISVPTRLCDDELEAFLRLEAVQYVPYPLEEVALDFFRLPSVDTTSSENVLLVVCRQAIIDDHRALMEQVDLPIRVIEPRSQAVQRLVQYVVPTSREACIAVVDNTGEQLQLTLLQDGEVHYNCNQPLPPEPLETELAATIGQLLRFACSTSVARPVQHVLLCGNVSATLLRSVQAETPALCAILQPFNALDIAPSIDLETLEPDASRLVAACGLAMRREI